MVLKLLNMSESVDMARTVANFSEYRFWAALLMMGGEIESSAQWTDNGVIWR